MKTLRKTVGDQVYFIIADLAPAYHNLVKDMRYEPVEEGFARSYQADAPFLDKAFENFTRYTETMILQKAGEQPAPWAESLLKFLELVSKHEIDWCLVGSAALSVRGIAVEPGDLDLVTSEADTIKLATLLQDHLVQPVQDTSGWVAKWFVRTFFGVTLEWLGGVTDAADMPLISDFGPVAMTRLETITWHNYPIRVPPLALQMEVNLRRGRTERANLIRDFLNKQA